MPWSASIGETKKAWLHRTPDAGIQIANRTILAKQFAGKRITIKSVAMDARVFMVFR
jgi:hypothetical protein